MLLLLLLLLSFFFLFFFSAFCSMMPVRLRASPQIADLFHALLSAAPAASAPTPPSSTAARVGATVGVGATAHVGAPAASATTPELTKSLANWCNVLLYFYCQPHVRYIHHRHFIYVFETRTVF